MKLNIQWEKSIMWDCIDMVSDLLMQAEAV